MTPEQTIEWLLSTGQRHTHLGFRIARATARNKGPFVIWRPHGSRYRPLKRGWGIYIGHEEARRFLLAKSFDNEIFKTLCAIIGNAEQDDSEDVATILACCEWDDA